MDLNQKQNTDSIQDAENSVTNSEKVADNENPSGSSNIEETTDLETKKDQTDRPVITVNEIVPDQESAPEIDDSKQSEEEPVPPIPIPVRVVKRGRSLIPRKEEATTAPSNFVDCPDYGYVGIDGSYQAPF